MLTSASYHCLSFSNCQIKDVPDLWVAGHGKSSWIEVKWFTRPLAPNDLPFRRYDYLTAGQQNWLQRAADHTDRRGSLLLVGCPNKHLLVSGADISIVRTSNWKILSEFAEVSSPNLDEFIRKFHEYWV